MTFSKLQFAIPFAAPILVTTAYGIRQRRTGTPTADFWIAWQKDKASLKQQGFEVTKLDNAFVVNYYTDLPETPVSAPANPKVTFDNVKGLLPYQIPHSEALAGALLVHGSYLDASDAGSGKTYAFFAVCRYFMLTPAIVCPKSVMPAWERVAAYFGIRPYFVMNWEGCKSKHFKHGFLDPITKEYTWHLGNTKILLAFDEAHKGKGEYSQNAKMIIAAKRQKIPTALLSATIATSPRDMRALGYMLGLHTLSDFRQWTIALGCYQNNFNGWGCIDPNGAMNEIHRNLFPQRGARIRIADLGDAFPDTQITADVYETGNSKQQNAAYNELLDHIADLKAKKLQGWSAAAMTLNLRYRQLAETLKVDTLAALAGDAVDNGLSVVIFANFTKTLEELKAIFPEAAEIHGQQTSDERQRNIDAFQDDKARIIIANIQAGGVGVSLHDINGLYPRLALICPTYSAKDLKQALGRVHRANGKSKSLQRVIYAAGTVEVDVCKTVARRLEALSSLNDGDLMEKDLLGVLG